MEKFNISDQVTNRVTLVVTKFTLDVTDRRTGEESTITVYRPYKRMDVSEVVSHIERFGYSAEVVNVKYVDCPISWEKVFNYYETLEENSHEGFEQTSED